jgi:NAD(P)-dependent dehydrogenase (short-subunit alcohol dehydrogenase family)
MSRIRSATPCGSCNPPYTPGRHTIRPGYTDSEMWQFLSDGQRDDLRRRVADALPVGRMGTPEDVAHAAIFLMTNPQVTGTVLEVTGGETLINTLE